MNLGRWSQRINRIKNHLSNLNFFMLASMYFKGGITRADMGLFSVLLIGLLVFAALDIKKIWSEEQEYTALKNPVFVRMLENQEKILNLLGIKK